MRNLGYVPDKKVSPERTCIGNSLANNVISLLKILPWQKVDQKEKYINVVRLS